jgi:hypothetical protein
MVLSSARRWAKCSRGYKHLFLPAYAASVQRMEVAGSKVFPEPIDGERLIATIERSMRMFSGAPDLFHVLDILQMCCLSGRSGALQMVSGREASAPFICAMAKSCTLRPAQNAETTLWLKS